LWFYDFGITTDRVKLFNRPETFDFFNPPSGGYLRKRGKSFFYNTLSPPVGGEFAVGDKVL
jgi:hypothetical protein